MKQFIIVVALLFSLTTNAQTTSNLSDAQKSELASELDAMWTRSEHNMSYWKPGDHPIHVGMIMGFESGYFGIGMEVNNLLSPVGAFFLVSGKPMVKPYDSKGINFSAYGTKVLKSETEVFDEGFVASSIGITIDPLYKSKAEGRFHVYLAGTELTSYTINRTWKLYQVTSTGVTSPYTAYHVQQEDKITMSTYVSYSFLRNGSPVYLSVMAGKVFGLQGASVLTSFGVRI